MASQLKFKTILIDPPWPQGMTGKYKIRPKRANSLPYPTMSIEEIAKLPTGVGNYFISRSQTILFGYKEKCIFSKKRYLPNIINIKHIKRQERL